MNSLRLRDAISLLKLRLALAIALAALLGYLLRPPSALQAAGLLFTGVLILAVGAGCLNNYQDRRVDCGSERTRNRPIPAGRVDARTALLLGGALMALGTLVLLAGPFPGSVPATAALATVCYNALYTPLKSRTLLALVPGIVCGALPPLVGWFAAGGPWHGVPIWSVMVVFGLWQPPHFWLIVLRYRGDYVKEDVPSMLTVFSRSQVIRILFVWVLALGIAMLALPFNGGPFAPLLVSALVADVLAMTALFLHQLYLRHPGPNYRLLFPALNMAVLFGVVLAVLHRRLGWL